MARGVLAQLGEPAVGLLQADRDNIWFRSEAMEIDLDRQEQALRAALAMGPGQDRDDRLVAALSDERTVLADAPYVEWALRCRDRFEVLRQQARLTLARDRSKGAGLSSTAAVLEAWESCLGHDPACEEAAAALMRLYTAQGARPEAVRTYERCRAALAELGLSTSPALGRGPSAGRVQAWPWGQRAAVGGGGDRAVEAGTEDDKRAFRRDHRPRRENGPRGPPRRRSPDAVRRCY